MNSRASRSFSRSFKRFFSPETVYTNQPQVTRSTSSITTSFTWRQFKQPPKPDSTCQITRKRFKAHVKDLIHTFWVTEDPERRTFPRRRPASRTLVRSGRTIQSQQIQSGSMSKSSPASLIRLQSRCSRNGRKREESSFRLVVFPASGRI